MGQIKMPKPLAKGLGFVDNRLVASSALSC
jgi:hypothetical protein